MKVQEARQKGFPNSWVTQSNVKEKTHTWVKMKSSILEGTEQMLWKITAIEEIIKSIQESKIQK